MIITQGRGGQILHQGHQQVMGGGQVLQGNMPQMAQQGPSSAPQGGNMFDDLNMEFLWTNVLHFVFIIYTMYLLMGHLLNCFCAVLINHEQN